MDEKISIKALLATVVMILTGIVASIQLYDWFLKPTDELIANVEYDSFKIPIGLVEKVDALRENSDSEKLAEKLSVKPDIENYVKNEDIDYVSSRLTSEIASFFRQEVPHNFLRPYSDIRGQWKIRLRNEGDTTLDSVSLSIPDLLYAEIKMEDVDDLTVHQKTDLMRVGNMLPGDNIEILVWSSTSPSRFDEDEVRLVHSKGHGELRFRSRVSPIWVWLDRNWGFLVFQTLFIGFWLYWVIASIRKDLIKRREKEQKEEPGKENEM